jgi:hypothetical protein
VYLIFSLEEPVKLMEPELNSAQSNDVALEIIRPCMQSNFLLQQEVMHHRNDRKPWISQLRGTELRKNETQVFTEIQPYHFKKNSRHAVNTALMRAAGATVPRVATRFSDNRRRANFAEPPKITRPITFKQY